jgi:hypothetical protein
MNQQMNNMAAMNNAGGPVGGTPLMNNAVNSDNTQEVRALLNTYIYDYFLKNKNYDLARQVVNELSVKVFPNGGKSSPNQRNGVDDMDMDSKDEKRPDDLPAPQIPGSSSSEEIFLLDWWYQFWDIYSAQRGRGKAGAISYVNHARVSVVFLRAYLDHNVCSGSLVIHAGPL